MSFSLAGLVPYLLLQIICYLSTPYVHILAGLGPGLRALLGTDGLW